MKKPKQKTRKKKGGRKKPLSQQNTPAANPEVAQTAKASKPKPQRPVPKKTGETKKTEDHSPVQYVARAGQFLRESRMELKKVKWPTRKELLASTAVVIVLTLFVAFFLGLVDFGLIKIIRSLIG